MAIFLSCSLSNDAKKFTQESKSLIKRHQLKRQNYCGRTSAAESEMLTMLLSWFCQQEDTHGVKDNGAIHHALLYLCPPSPI